MVLDLEVSVLYITTITKVEIRHDTTRYFDT